jgi:hypothetical protein
MPAAGTREAGQDGGGSFLRAETLHAANDAISNATAALSMFEQYDIGGMKPFRRRRWVRRSDRIVTPPHLLATAGIALELVTVVYLLPIAHPYGAPA